MEIHAKQDEKMLGSIISAIVFKETNQFLGLLICVECFQRLVILKNRVIVHDIKTETRWINVTIFKLVEQEIIITSEIFVRWKMNPLLFLYTRSRRILTSIMSTKEHCFEAHIVKESSVCVAVTKRIDLPSNSWCDIKCFKDPLLTNHHVVNHVFINWISFVMHRPPSIDKFKLFIINKTFDLLLLVLRL
jgi:hypothetical protein